MRLPLKIPYIETGCILSLPLLPTMSTCLAKSLRAAIFPPCKIILFCILKFSFKFGWTGYMKIFIQLSPGNGTFFFKIWLDGLYEELYTAGPRKWNFFSLRSLEASCIHVKDRTLDLLVKGRTMLLYFPRS